jgi:hypothetical protein
MRRRVQKRPGGRAAHIVLAFLLAFMLGAAWLATVHARPAAVPPPHLRYGFNVAEWDTALLEEMGFDWIKLFGPPGGPLPQNVLVRLDANAGDLADLAGFGDAIGQLASAHGAYIDAYEIGNEPNLDASYGWAAPPVAADYATVLCEAYAEIKAADPGAIVVSAGLAPTGRVAGTWNGHAGHNGFFQDEREFLKEFFAAGGGDCLDAVGYHPYGFSADYDAAPDVASADPTQNCANGFCFRGAEKIYELMQGAGFGDKQVWATEFGWLVRPPDHCLSHPSFSGREWQLVTAEKQAANLVGAFTYADQNWPWMGGMFVFNLNFNTASWITDECEQMRYYAVRGRPAEDALREMPKRPVGAAPELAVAPAAVSLMADVDSQPLAYTISLRLQNEGWQLLTYTATVPAGNELTPAIVGDASGTLSPTAQTTVQIRVSSSGRTPGIYTGTVLFYTEPSAGGPPPAVPVRLSLLGEVHGNYLPVLLRP